MLKKLCYLVPVVVLIMVMGTNSARGDVLHWSGAGTDPYWHTPTNWDKGVVPQGGDDAYCKKNSGKPDPNFTSLSSSEPLCLLCIADIAADGELNIDSGTLNVASALRTTKASTGARTAKVTMKGGTVALYGRNVTVGTCVGNNTTDGSFNFGPNDAVETVDSTWTMTGGLITTGTFTVPSAGTNSNSIFNLNGGTVIVREPSTGLGGAYPNAATGFFVNEAVNTDRTGPNAYRRCGGRGGELNIAGGTMIIQGNVTPLFKNRVDNGPYGGGSQMGLIDPCNVIRAYPNEGTTYNKYLVYDYDQRNDGKTTITAAKQAIEEAWNPGDLADPCLFPFNGALSADTAPTLKWTGGAGASDGHDVYFGTSTNFGDPCDTIAPGDPCQYAPGTLELGEKYYWQAVAQPSGQAELWEFAVEGKAKGANPVSGLVIEPNSTRNVLLSWTGYPDATSHDVYFGTSTNFGDPNSNDQPGTTRIVKGVLGKTCFWRIDENIKNGGGTVVGNIWSFQVADHDLVENFESYTTATIGSRWFLNGMATDDLAVNSGRNYKDPVKGGKQGLALTYNLSSAGTAAEYTLFTEDQDWDAADCGAVTLSIWMRGKGNNVDPNVTKLYVQLASGTSTSSTEKSGKVTVDNFSEVLADNHEDWKSVNIALSDFTTGAGGSFSLGSVRRLFIGVETNGAAKGSLWIDDIRLYITRCVDQASRVPQADQSTRADATVSDITDDCRVNGYDLYKITDVWLDSNTTVDANGVVKNASSATQWVAGKYSNALKLGASSDWVDIDDLAFPNFNNRTIALWVKIDERPGPAVDTRQMIFSTSSNWRLNISGERKTDGTELDAQVGNGFPEPVDPAVLGNVLVTEGSWHHVALTVGSIIAGDVDVTFYVDGGNAATDTYEANYYSELRGICLGALKNGVSQHSNITVDDFRIYDRALTSSEVLALKNGTPPGDNPLIKFDFNEASGTVVKNTGSISTVNHPVGYSLGSGGDPDPKEGVSLGELYTGADGGKTYINMKDYARLAKHWLYGSPTPWVYP